MMGLKICGVSRMLQSLDGTKNTFRWTTNSWIDYTKRQLTGVRAMPHNTSSIVTPNDSVTMIDRKKWL